jgi:hypothetical protein
MGKTLVFWSAIAIFLCPVLWMGQYVHAATHSLVLGVLLGFIAGGVLGGFLSIPFLLAWDFLSEKLAPVSRPADPVAALLAERKREALAAGERFAQHDEAPIARAMESSLLTVSRSAYDENAAGARNEREPVWGTAKISPRGRERSAA